MTSDLDVLDAVSAFRPTDEQLDREWPAARRAAVLERVRTAAPDAPIRFVARRPQHRRRRWALATVAVGVAAAAAVAVPLLLPADAPGGSTNAGAATLEKLAVAAANTPADLVQPGQFRHLVDREIQNGDQPMQTVHESWTAYDGRIWRKDTLLSDFLGRHGVVDYYQFPPGGASVNAPTPQFLASLPTEPGELHRYLKKHVSGSTSRDEAVFVAVGDMLRGGFAPPMLRAAAIRMLEHAGHVTVRQGIDSQGHTAIVVSFRDRVHRPGETDSIYFDPATSAIEEETTTLCRLPAVPSAATAAAGAPAAVLASSVPSGDEWNSPPPPSVGCTAGDHDPVFFRSVYSGSATVDAVPADVLAKAALQR
jgi:hypothetical protein